MRLSSWELGTAAEALTELSWPSLSIFSSKPFPPPDKLNATFNASDVLQIATQTVQLKPFDSMALVANDGATGDPASKFIHCSHLICLLIITQALETLYYSRIGRGLKLKTQHILLRLVSNCHTF